MLMHPAEHAEAQGALEDAEVTAGCVHPDVGVLLLAAAGERVLLAGGPQGPTPRVLGQASEAAGRRRSRCPCLRDAAPLLVALLQDADEVAPPPAAVRHAAAEELHGQLGVAAVVQARMAEAGDDGGAVLLPLPLGAQAVAEAPRVLRGHQVRDPRAGWKRAVAQEDGGQRGAGLANAHVLVQRDHGVAQEAQQLLGEAQGVVGAPGADQVPGLAQLHSLDDPGNQGDQQTHPALAPVRPLGVLRVHEVRRHALPDADVRCQVQGVEEDCQPRVAKYQALASAASQHPILVVREMCCGHDRETPYPHAVHQGAGAIDG
mmetsp:Transcript_30890/g.83696  ORF Transcript_30890/g.83696 Transcript_30890/m.83696 type:complete len:318 (+) Transcript_30890:719-1672(+)